MVKKIKESLNIGKDEGKKENGIYFNILVIFFVLKMFGKINVLSGVVIGLENKLVVSVE